MKDSFSDYIVYVDESGDHSLVASDRAYPVFVLAFCIFHKDDYLRAVAPAIQRFKFRHFGHDVVVLHENEIRKDKGNFKFLKSPRLKDTFVSELGEVIADASFTLVCVVIDKTELGKRYAKPHNPYHLALKYGLERVCHFLLDKKQQGRITHLIVEQRGSTEDRQLESAFQTFANGEKRLSLKLILADKKINSAGLQLADLVARPVGLSLIRPGQSNRAFQIIRGKLYSVRGKMEGWGLKYFP